MVQILVPTATGTTNWSSQPSGPNHLQVDEGIASADDGSTYIFATRGGFVTRLQLSAGSDPIVHTGHVLRVRWARIGTAQSCQLILRQGVAGSNIYSASHTVPLNVWTTLSVPLTTIQAALITNYADLWVLLQTATGSDPIGHEYRVTATELEVPDFVEPERRFTRMIVDAMADKPVEPARRFTRQAIDVMAKFTAEPQRAFTRASVDVSSKTPPWTRFTRYGVDVMSGLPANIQRSFTRASVDVMAQRPAPVGIEARFTRQSVDVMARRVIPGVIVPLPLPSIVAPIFIHNWRVDLARNETTWSTSVDSAAESVAEERVSLIDRPYRRTEAALTGMDRDASARLISSALRRGTQREPFPIYSDVTTVDQEAVASTELFCDTTLRRFSPGGRVAIARIGRSGESEQTTFTTIATVLPDRLLLDDPVNASPLDRVYPLMDAEVALDRESSTVTDEHVVAGMIVDEVFGRSALTSTETSEQPADFQVGPRGYPVLHLGVHNDAILNVQEHGVVQSGEKTAAGRAREEYLRGDRPAFRASMSPTALRRADAWRLVRFFDSRKGRARPFWFIDPQTRWEVVSFGAGGNAVELRLEGPFENVEDFVVAVGIVLLDGTVIVREVVPPTGTITNPFGGPTWRGFWAEDLPFVPSLSDVKRVSAAYLVRFESDTMIEEWQTLDTMQTDWSVVELLSEGDVSLGA